jgi:hypothetical protein
MAQLKPGSRWTSSVCDTEVIVVKGPPDEVELTCGGVTMVAAGEEPAAGSLDDGASEGTLLGKRYVNDGDTMEVLCTRPGTGSLGADGSSLQLKEAKPLPASD